ncbi:MAG TPA: alpha/beta hydrolase, partial [Thermoanaerobaculia bacterium]|nr:alpha/beta hydrolase [Thermoanaerobaculia bacterium]
IFPGFMVKALLRERYDSRAAAKEVRVPALVIHGERDELIPVSQGKEIAETLAGSTRWVPVPRAGHNDLLGERVVWEEMEGFFRGIGG